MSSVFILDRRSAERINKVFNLGFIHEALLDLNNSMVIHLDATGVEDIQYLSEIIVLIPENRLASLRICGGEVRDSDIALIHSKFASSLSSVCLKNRTDVSRVIELIASHSTWEKFQELHVVGCLTRSESSPIDFSGIMHLNKIVFSESMLSVDCYRHLLQSDMSKYTESIYISNCRINDHVALEITRTAQSNCKYLQELDFESNEISYSGFLEIGSALENTSIRVGIHNNKLRHEDEDFLLVNHAHRFFC
jgi:hypothetical protein